MLEVQVRGIGVAGCGGELGDVDGSGSINVMDVISLINHILEVVILDEMGQCRADCDGSGSLNVMDALAIVNVILDKIPACPGGGGCKPEVTPDVIAFLKVLEPHFPAGKFAEFMAMVKEVEVPTEYTLSQNYPNPFNPTTTINFQIPNSKSQSPPHTTLKIYNILGQEVRVLVDEVKDAGYYTVTWDGMDGKGNSVPSGVYFYRLTVDRGQWSETRRMVLMK